MSSARKQWEMYLFFQHNLVSLSPLNRDLQLLDVLVKKGSHGFVRDRGPIIVRIGSILSLRNNDDNPDWKRWASTAEDSLRRLRHNEDLHHDELFSTGSVGDFEVKREFASNIHLSLSTVVGAGGDRERLWSASALNVTSEKFSEDAAKDLFYGDSALWKPDLPRIKLEQPSMSGGKLELWVVKEIQYAKEIKISSSSSHGAHGKLDLAPAVAGVTIPKVEAEAGKTKDGATQDMKGSKVPFAFKAIRLVYEENGDLIAKHSDMGKRRPRIMPDSFEEEEVCFSCSVSDSFEEVDPMYYFDADRDPMYYFDADRDPMYHMGGLFVPYRERDEEEGCVQLLDLVTNGDLIAKHSDMGKRRPSYGDASSSAVDAFGERDEEVICVNDLEPYFDADRDPMYYFDADRDPMYHMGGPFAQASCREGDEEEG